MDFDVIAKEHIAPAVLGAASATGVSYLASNYGPKQVQAYGRLFQAVHFVGAAAIGAVVYTTIEGVLKKNNWFKPKDEKEVALVRHSVASLAGVVAAAGAGYGAVALGLVAASASTAALVAAAVAAVAIALHILFKEVISSLNEDVENKVKKEEKTTTVENKVEKKDGEGVVEKEVKEVKKEKKSSSSQVPILVTTTNA